MACPLCGCERFHIKDPDDPYEVQEVVCRQGRICPADDAQADAEPAPDAELYCQRCAWHGKADSL